MQKKEVKHNQDYKSIELCKIISNCRIKMNISLFCKFIIYQFAKSSYDRW